MAKAIRLMETGLIDAEAIISHRFPLGRIHDALAVMQTPEHNKIIIHP
jgi:threonine dehydrogenase-like Zn-dependent dehydrogenase